jgi:hypothetical protein
MPYNKQECISHIQKTVNLLTDLEAWEDMAFVEAQSLGLQGEKRENRYEGTIDGGIRKYLQSEAFDLFDAKIHVNPSSIHFAESAEPVEFLEMYCAGLWDIMYKLHDAANMLVSPHCLRSMATPVYARCECIKDAIIDISRKIKRYRAVEKHGTPLHDLYRESNTAETKHDRFEPLEKSVNHPD